MTAAASPRGGMVVAIGLGVLAVVGGTLAGALPAGSLDGLMTPPPLLRAALVGGFAGLGVVLLVRSVRRMAEAGQHDVPGVIRGVRLAFLAVAAFAAAGGWALGHPLPVILAAIIAGIDVIETSFLLLISRGR
ncbi:MAG: hypothetical protein ACLGIJ_04430 [Candidatus Limnocylindria bacterium]